MAFLRAVSSAIAFGKPQESQTAQPTRARGQQGRERQSQGFPLPLWRGHICVAPALWSLWFAGTSVPAPRWLSVQSQVTQISAASWPFVCEQQSCSGEQAMLPTIN